MVSESFRSSFSNLATLNVQERKSQEQFLRFHLVPETDLMLPVEQVTEVVNISVGQIVPIPHLPAWVMGVYNWRGEILWMVDLGSLFGLTPWHEQPNIMSNVRAIVLKSTENKTGTMATRERNLGLVVDRVEDTEWCNPQEIQSPPSSAVTSSLAPFVRGYWLKPNSDLIVAIDGDAILEAMPQT